MNNNQDTTIQAEQKQDATIAEQKIPEAQVKTEEPKTEEDPNWRAFREARKKDRAEKEAAEKRATEKEAEALALKAAMEAAFAKSPTPQQQYQQQQYEGQYQEQQPNDDARIEKAVQKALAEREQLYAQQRAQREATEYPERLRQTYSDFDQVVTQETLDYLDYHYPEVSNPLQRLQDGFDKWSDVYKNIKKFVPNQSNAKRDAAKAQNNLNKPKSMSSPGLPNVESNPGAVHLTKERRQANWERMQRTLRQVGN
jgi:hypothetical protein